MFCLFRSDDVCLSPRYHNQLTLGSSTTQLFLTMALVQLEMSEELMRVKNGIPESMIVHCCLSSSSLARSISHYLRNHLLRPKTVEWSIELAGAVIVKPRPFFVIRRDHENTCARVLYP